jgi:hypothetical protein
MTNSDLFGDPIKPPVEPDEEIPVFSDGVRADSQEGIRRALANLKEIRRRLQGKSLAKALWRGKARRRIEAIDRKIATGIFPDELVRKMRAEKFQLQRDLARAEKPMREWDFALGRPKDPEPQQETVRF